MGGDLGKDADGSELGRCDLDRLKGSSNPFSRGLLLMSAIPPYYDWFLLLYLILDRAYVPLKSDSRVK